MDTSTGPVFYKFRGVVTTAILLGADDSHPRRAARLEVHVPEEIQVRDKLGSTVIMTDCPIAEPFNQRLPKNGEWFRGWPYGDSQPPMPRQPEEPEQFNAPGSPDAPDTDSQDLSDEKKGARTVEEDNGNQQQSEHPTTTNEEPVAPPIGEPISEAAGAAGGGTSIDEIVEDKSLDAGPGTPDDPAAD